MSLSSMFRQALEENGYFDDIRGTPQFESIMNQSVGNVPVGGIRGPAPVMPTMPQIPQMNALPMQGGMVDFNALAGMMAGPAPNLAPFFSSPAPGASASQGVGNGGPNIAPPPGKVPSPFGMGQGGGLIAQLMGQRQDQPSGLIGRLLQQHVAQTSAPSRQSGAMLDPRMRGLL